MKQRQKFQSTYPPLQQTQQSSRPQARNKTRTRQSRCTEIERYLD